MHKNWIVTQHGAIAMCIFMRPPINMMSFVALEELDALLQALEVDTGVAVIVIGSDIPGYFIAHADLEDIGRMARKETPVGDPAIVGRVHARLENMPQPTVAAVNGQAWGGGCELALACTFRLATRAAHFCQMEVSKGAIPGAGGTQRLPRLIGLSRASLMILSGRVVAADEALAWGLVDAILPEDQFHEHVLEWLQPIARQPRHALLLAKESIMAGLYLPLEQGLENERRLFMQAVAAKAFVDK